MASTIHVHVRLSSLLPDSGIAFIIALFDYRISRMKRDTFLAKRNLTPNIAAKWNRQNRNENNGIIRRSIAYLLEKMMMTFRDCLNCHLLGVELSMWRYGQVDVIPSMKHVKTRRQHQRFNIGTAGHGFGREEAHTVALPNLQKPQVASSPTRRKPNSLHLPACLSV